MPLFKLSIRDGVWDRPIAASVLAGPFVVAADDETSARDLVVLNCNSVADAVPANTVPIRIWRDGDGSNCRPLAEIHEDDIRQRHFVNGTDIAPWYLSELQLSDPRGELAHMVWWPLKPDDTCPV